MNLAWAVDRVLAAAEGAHLAEALAIHEEQRAVDRAIGEHGAALIPQFGAILTHCNTGPLATAGGGTALGVIIAAHRAGKQLHVYADETRPLLQGVAPDDGRARGGGDPGDGDRRRGRGDRDAAQAHRLRDRRSGPHRDERRHGE